MMSAQMLSAASNISGTVADLAPGAKDGMRMLEAKAAEMSGKNYLVALLKILLFYFYLQ